MELQHCVKHTFSSLSGSRIFRHFGFPLSFFLSSLYLLNSSSPLSASSRKSVRIRKDQSSHADLLFPVPLVHCVRHAQVRTLHTPSILF